jgi:NADPH:quinone reductase-like Zn-dependent oxidoreductase
MLAHPFKQVKCSQRIQTSEADYTRSDVFMHQFGILVNAWPFTPGCDAGGIVVKVGSSAKSILGEPFKVGDRVSGCTRLGWYGYAPYAEYFLMDAALVLPVVPGMSLDKACTLGVATYTASLGLFKELNLPVPKPGENPAAKDEWLLVFGGASSVGKAAVQIAKSLGYKVITTGSTGSAEVCLTTS